MKGKPRSGRRMAVRAVVCAGVGVVVTVGVAWGFSVRGPIAIPVTTDLPPSNPSPFQPGEMLEHDHDPGPGVEFRVRALGVFAYYRHPRMNSVRDMATDLDVRTGWPILGMQAVHHFDLSTAGTREDWAGIKAPEWLVRLKAKRNFPFRPMVTRGRLPVTPLWPGFAIDTAFYAAIAFTVWSAPGAVRRRVRRSRGRCPSCGYDLRGNTSDVCPECGAASPPLRL